MSSTFVGAAAGENTAAMPAHQAGDHITLFAFRDTLNNVTPPTIPSGQGWVDGGQSGGASNASSVIVSKVATSAAEGVGTFTNATTVIILVRRPASGFTLSTGSVAQTGGLGASVTVPALTLIATNGLSVVNGFLGHRSLAGNPSDPPGLTRRIRSLDSVDDVIGWDTAEAVPSFAERFFGWGASSGWRGASLEVQATASDGPARRPPRHFHWL